MKIKGLTVIFVLTSIITFWINFIDFKFNAFWIFSNKADKAETVIDNLCLSYIAGYIFYFLNVYLVEKQEKKSILPYISFKTNLIISNSNHIIKVLKQDVHLKEFYPALKEFEELLKYDNVKDLKIYNYENHNLVSFLMIRRNSTVKTINKILKSGKHVDDELKSILFSLKDSLFLKKGFAFNLPTFDIKKFPDYDLVFFKYFQDIERLDLYFHKNFKKYYLLNYPKHYRRKLAGKLKC
ncbi:hypothetical protein ACFFLS_06155 [Flavobacterium procerum]|uniref:Phage abortive infection protein n=1 Tax=Flavobacterium procerum TaxID=1455569 RepID=A0ABV6BMD9_9FLAO